MYLILLDAIAGIGFAILQTNVSTSKFVLDAQKQTIKTTHTLKHLML